MFGLNPREITSQHWVTCAAGLSQDVSTPKVSNHPVLWVLLGSWQVLMRCIASALFLLAHGLLVLEHIAIGTALHGVAELFLAPWALRHKAWDIIVIGLIFCVFDLWGTLRLTGALV